MDIENFTEWKDEPGLYAIFNIDGQTAITEKAEAGISIIYGSYDYFLNLHLSNLHVSCTPLP